MCRRSDFLRNRTPKRRTQPLTNSGNISTNSAASTNTITSHEEEKEDGASLTENGPEKAPKSTNAESTSPTRPHSHRRRERYCKALQPSLLLPTDTGESKPPASSLNDSMKCSPLKPPIEEVTPEPPRKSRRRPVTLDSLDDFSPASANAVSTSSSPPSDLSLPKAKHNTQGWLWLKKRSSASFGNRYVKRWCVFKHNTLYYYRNKEEKNAEGLILLHGFTISPLPAEGGGRSGRYSFRVYNEWTRFVFAADSEGARTRWMNMLGLAAIGQSACLWTSPIGGFHPGYLPAPSNTEVGAEAAGTSEKEAVEPNPRLVEPSGSQASDGENTSRRQPVVGDSCFYDSLVELQLEVIFIFHFSRPSTGAHQVLTYPPLRGFNKM